MKQAVVAFVLVFGPGLWNTTAAQASSEISVRSEINKGFVTIGERVRFTVLIRHSPEIRLLTVPEFPNPRDFELKSVKDIPSRAEAGFVITGRQFEVAAYGLGEFVIDEMPIQYADGSGKMAEVRTNRIYVTVESVDKSGKPKIDIRGIKGPVDLPVSLGGLFALAGALGLSGCAGLAWYFWLRKKAAPVPEETLLSPYDEAYQALRRLFDSPLIREGKVKEYYFELSEIIRRYLERRFSFRATEKTTDEIAVEFKAIFLQETLKHAIRRFLEDADIVKFAKYIPEPREIVDMNKRAMEVLEKTKPVEAPVLPQPAKTGS